MESSSPSYLQPHYSTHVFKPISYQPGALNQCFYPPLIVETIRKEDCFPDEKKKKILALWEHLFQLTTEFKNINEKNYFLREDQVDGMFEDILCPKHSAMKFEGQYLHANLLSNSELEENSKVFVASQLPTAVEATSFWKLVALGDYTLIDLTNKSGFQYYPNEKEGPLEFDESCALNVQFESKDLECCNHLLVKYAYNVEGVLPEIKHSVVRMHFEYWPDHGTINVEVLSQLIEYVDHHTNRNIWVHCRAGVGRTGTFVTAFMVHELIRQQMITKENFGDKLVGLVIDLRKQRGPEFVQNFQQFCLIYDYGMLLLNK